MSNDLFKEVREDVLVAEQATAYHEERIDEYFKGIAPGMYRPNDYEFLQFVTVMRQKFPPEEFVDPEGRKYFESPYILLWKHGENSKDDWERLQRLAPGGPSLPPPMAPPPMPAFYGPGAPQAPVPEPPGEML